MELEYPVRLLIQVKGGISSENRGEMVVRMHRRRDGEEGIYRCVIPDAMNVTQTIYIGVYSASTGEWYMYTPVLFNYGHSSLFI